MTTEAKREPGWLKTLVDDATNRNRLENEVKSLNPAQVKAAIQLIKLLKCGRTIISPAPEAS